MACEWGISHQSITANSPTAPQPHSFTASQPHSPTASQPHSLTAPRPHSPTASQSHSLTAPQLHSPTVPQPQSYSPTASQPHSPTASQPHSPTAPQTPSSNFMRYASFWCPPSLVQNRRVQRQSSHTPPASSNQVPALPHDDPGWKIEKATGRRDVLLLVLLPATTCSALCVCSLHTVRGKATETAYPGTEGSYVSSGTPTPLLYL